MTSEAALIGRVERLRHRLPRGGGWWIARPPHVMYLTGVLSQPDYPATLIVTADAIAALWPGEEPAAAPAWVDAHVYDPWPAAGTGAGLAATTVEVLDEYGLRGAAPVLVDADSVPLVLAESTTPVPSGDAIGAVTRLKDAEEIAVIRRNLAGNDRAFARLGREVGAGVTDLEVAAWAMGEVSVHAGAIVRYDGNVGLGPAGADPEAQPAGRVAAIGDLLFVDLYPMRGGYGGDSARSFHLGSPDTWAAASHERLVRALEAAERKIAPGVPAAEIDGLCRDAAADEDGATYPHHSGHGFGLFAQERPYLVPGSTDVLQEGDVVAIEPGAYRPGRGGMRLEDAFVVTAGGCERLNSAPRELKVCG